MPQRATTPTDAQADKSAQSGSPWCKPGPCSLAAIRSARFRSLVGGLTRLNGLPMCTPYSPGSLHDTAKPRRKSANGKGG